MPRPPDIRVGLLTEDDLVTHQVGQLQGAETDGGAALHFYTMSE